MKKFLFLALAAMVALLPLSAKEKQTFDPNQAATFGAHISAGDGFTLGVQAQYNLDEPIRLEGHVSTRSAHFPYIIFGVNGHYLFPINQKLTLYPVVGVEAGLGNAPGYIGANFGVGAQLELTNNIFLTTELTEIIRHASTDRLTVGMHYRF